MRITKIFILLLFLMYNNMLASEETPTKDEVSKLYVATFNRAPDSGGLDYWINDSGLKLSEIAKSFFDQEETQQLYPNSTTTREFVKAVYNNLFNRDPDTAGWDYWETELDEGRFERNQFILAVINGALDNENGQDRTILQYKNEIGLYYANSGLDDTTEAKVIMRSITSDDNSVDIAKAKIDSIEVVDGKIYITHNSISYGVVTSPITGKRWLDRNLGATQPCTVNRDNGTFSNNEEYVAQELNCFGDLYQWGRLTDGHEKRTSGVTETKVASIDNAGSNFISQSSALGDWTTIDSDGILRETQWSVIDGTSVCPIGFRVPTSEELYAETSDYNGTNNEETGAVKVTNRNTALKNFLKLPPAGKRKYSDGSIYDVGAVGSVWTSNAGTISWTLEFNERIDEQYKASHAYAHSIRCIEDASAGTSSSGSTDTVAPQFTSSSVLYVDEGKTSVSTITATDENEITYSISGTDSNSLTINSSTGVLSFVNPPVYNVKSVYYIIVTATDSSNNSSTQNLTININDVSDNNEPTVVTHDSYSYNVITSPITGKRWLDRNLGASEVCSSSRDDESGGVKIYSSDSAYVLDQEACFGDLYQWGRLTDGHEKTDSQITYIQSSSITNAGTSFIRNYAANSEWTSTDESGVLRENQWSRTDGSSICPIGFRVPTVSEILAETTNYTGQNNFETGAVKVSNRKTAYQNFLKLPSSGSRSALYGTLSGQGNFGGLWAVDAGENSPYIIFNSSTASQSTTDHAAGYSIRCIKSDTIIVSDTEAPVFTSSDSFNTNEEQSETFTITTTDASTVTYSVSGTDGSYFNIGTTSGLLTFKSSPDYETKNKYEFTIIATDSAGNSSTQYVTININNVDESKITTTITHAGYTYNIITSPITGRKWLDRNLGATTVCTASRDEEYKRAVIYSNDEEYVQDQQSCFGDLYQWGRLTDGHEKTDSTVTYVQAKTITNVGSNFIRNYASNSEWTTIDEDASLREAQWTEIDGSTICPVGFRVPTISELLVETKNYTGQTNETTGAVAVTDRASAFKNFLKLPASGSRSGLYGDLQGQGNYGALWASDAGVDAPYLLFNSTNSIQTTNDHTHGYSVRCIKN